MDSSYDVLLENCCGIRGLWDMLLENNQLTTITVTLLCVIMHQTIRSVIIFL